MEMTRQFRSEKGNFEEDSSWNEGRIKNSVAQLENSVEKLGSRMNEAEYRLSRLKDKVEGLDEVSKL